MRYSNHACPLISKDHYVNYPGRKEDFDEFSKRLERWKRTINIHGTRHRFGVVTRTENDYTRCGCQKTRAFTLRGQTIKKCTATRSLTLSLSLVSFRLPRPVNEIFER